MVEELHKTPERIASFMVETHPAWIINDLIAYAETDSMGLGVFALTDIAEDTEIICEPVRSFSGQDAVMLRETEAYHLTFVDRVTYRSGDAASSLHVVFGAVSILNHNKDNNCLVRWNIDTTHQSPNVKLFSKKFIPAGEELFIQYHNIGEYDFD